MAIYCVPFNLCFECLPYYAKLWSVIGANNILGKNLSKGRRKQGLTIGTDPALKERMKKMQYVFHSPIYKPDISNGIHLRKRRALHSRAIGSKIPARSKE